MTSPPAAAAAEATKATAGREDDVSSGVAANTSPAPFSAAAQTQQKPHTRGRSCQIDATADTKLREIMGNRGPGSRNARLVQEKLAQPPYNAALPYEVVCRRLKQLAETENKQTDDSMAELPVPGDGEAQSTPREGETEEGEQELRDHSAVARDLDMLAETVRSIVHQVPHSDSADENSPTSAQAGIAATARTNKESASSTDAVESSEGIQAGVAAARAHGGESTKLLGVEYSSELRQTCLALHANGATYRQIAEQLAVPTPSVQSIVRCQTAASNSPTPAAASEAHPRRRAGRPRAITQAMEQRIMALVLSSPGVGPRVVLETLEKEHSGLEVSFETIRRRVQLCRSQLTDAHEPIAGGSVESPVLVTTSDGSVAAYTTKRQLPSAAEASTPKKKKPRRAEYSHEIRAKCVQRHEVDGASYATIAREMEMPQDSVRSIVRKAKRTGSVNSAPRSGRPRKTSGIVDKVILQAVKTNERCSAKAIQEELERVFGVKVSSETVRRRVMAHTKQRLLAISTGITEASAAEKEPSNASTTAPQQATTTVMPLPVTEPLETDEALADSISFRQLLHEERTVAAIDTAATASLPPSAVAEVQSTAIQPPPEATINSPIVATSQAQAQISTSQSEVPVAASASKKRRAKRGEYSIAMREQCVALHEQGYGYRRIGKTLSMPHTTVRAIVEKVQRTGTVLPAARSGRPRKTDGIVDKVILQAVKTNEKSSARVIQDQLLAVYDVRVSCETIRRRVKDHSRQCLLQAAVSSSTIAPPSASPPRPVTDPEKGAPLETERVD